jgi:hypothetical protein
VNVSSLRYSRVCLPVCSVNTRNLEHRDDKCGALLLMDMKSGLSLEGKIIG